MMIRKSLIIISVFLFSLPAISERVAIYTESAKNTQSFVKTLKERHEKFTKLLAMRMKVDLWEKQLKQEDKRLHNEKMKQVNDLKEVKSGKMKQSVYEQRWKQSGRDARTNQEIKKFRSEIKKYNNYRLGYNLLAKELAKHLQSRNPGDVKNLVKKIELLIVNLQQAINDENFEKAHQIAKASKLANEFGYITK